MSVKTVRRYMASAVLDGGTPRLPHHAHRDRSDAQRIDAQPADTEPPAFSTSGKDGCDRHGSSGRPADAETTRQRRLASTGERRSLQRHGDGHWCTASNNDCHGALATSLVAAAHLDPKLTGFGNLSSFTRLAVTATTTAGRDKLGLTTRQSIMPRIFPRQPKAWSPHRRAGGAVSGVTAVVATEAEVWAAGGEIGPRSDVDVEVEEQ